MISNGWFPCARHVLLGLGALSLACVNSRQSQQGLIKPPPSAQVKNVTAPQCHNQGWNLSYWHPVENLQGLFAPPKQTIAIEPQTHVIDVDDAGFVRSITFHHVDTGFTHDNNPISDEYAFALCHKFNFKKAKYNISISADDVVLQASAGPIKITPSQLNAQQTGATSHEQREYEFAMDQDYLDIPLYISVLERHGEASLTFHISRDEETSTGGSLAELSPNEVRKEFFPNRNLTELLATHDKEIPDPLIWTEAENWQNGAAHHSGIADNFSIRYTKPVQPGYYHFSSKSDDGIRTFMQLESGETFPIDSNWNLGPENRIDSFFDIRPQFKNFIVEYFEGDGLANYQFKFNRLPDQNCSSPWLKYLYSIEGSEVLSYGGSVNKERFCGESLQRHYHPQNKISEHFPNLPYRVEFSRFLPRNESNCFCFRLHSNLQAKVNIASCHLPHGCGPLLFMFVNPGQETKRNVCVLNDDYWFTLQADNSNGPNSEHILRFDMLNNSNECAGIPPETL